MESVNSVKVLFISTVTLMSFRDVLVKGTTAQRYSSDVPTSRIALETMSASITVLLYSVHITVKHSVLLSLLHIVVTVLSITSNIPLLLSHHHNANFNTVLLACIALFVDFQLLLLSTI